jgi:hypothetical protein
MKGKVLLYVAVLLVGVSTWLAFRRNAYDVALQGRAVATRVLAEELARRFPNSTALIISNPFAEHARIRKNISAVEEAGISGLRLGFGDKVRVAGVVYPPIRPEAEKDPRSVHIPDTTTPLSYLVAEDSLDQMAAAHPDCDLLVSLIGLPARLDKVALWSQEGPPRLALLLPDLRMVGDADKLRQAVKSGKLVAFVLPKPGAPPDQTPIKKDYLTEFGQRYILVTEDNLEEELKKNPQLFHFGPAAANY